MQEISEFINLNDRQKTITMEAKIQGQDVKGDFTVKFPSALDIIKYESRLSGLLTEASVPNMTAYAYNLAATICYLDAVIVRKPYWYDENKIDDLDFYFRLYNEVKEFENSFRSKDEEEESKGNSDKPVDEEVVEGK